MRPTRRRSAHQSHSTHSGVKHAHTHTYTQHMQTPWVTPTQTAFSKCTNSKGVLSWLSLIAWACSARARAAASMARSVPRHQPAAGAPPPCTHGAWQMTIFNPIFHTWLAVAQASAAEWRQLSSTPPASAWPLMASSYMFRHRPTRPPACSPLPCGHHTARGLHTPTQAHNHNKTPRRLPRLPFPSIRS